MTGADLQLLIDQAPEGSVINLPPGVIPVSRPAPGLPNPDRLSDLRTRRSITLVGHSHGTTLAMVGGAGDRRLFDVLDGTVTLQSITFDGTAREGTGEQTHLIHCSGGKAVVINCRFTLPSHGDTTGGDGIKVSGGSLRAIGCTFDTCDRSAISVHHGGPVEILDCSANNIGDSALDVEPPSGVVVQDIYVDGFTVTGHVGSHDAINLSRCSGVVLRDVNLWSAPITFTGAKSVKADNLQAGEVTIRRSGPVLIRSSSLGVVKVTSDGVGTSRDVLLRSCQLRASGGLAALEVDDCGAYLQDCLLEGQGGAPAIFRGIKAPASGALVNCNLVGWTAKPFLAPRDYGVAWLLED